ncbi:SubName: Full=Related to WD-repeat protein crb3 {ECO:0000313/EMBL:CCA68749.1} [Serendipita indica DSM 11827]|nr:SubName: Full=Related to WD-repeat protein crb3 {ECO:0000313/EMBL:CCA68749.1} [Serendipita indica DSM 11827]
MNELLVAAADSVGLYNIQTGGAPVAAFGIPPAAQNATALVPTKNNQGGLVFSAAASKPLLHVYSFQKNQPLHNFVVPEKLSCLDIDTNATWCVAGSASGRIYVWEVASGALFKSFAAHYRAVTVIRFHSDGETFVTGSEDSSISIWSISRIVDYEQENQVPTPLLTLSDHTLPITSIRLGFGTLSSARIFSSSLDSTVKVWSIDAHTSADSAGPSSTLLATFGFSVSIIDIAIDPLERFFFAATSKDNGEIFVTRMYTDNQDVPHRSLLTGGIGETHAVSSSNAKSITAGSKVSTLALTTTSQLLIGTHSGLIHVYDTLSLQLLRTISTSQSPSPTPVTFLTTVPKPIDLIGHVQLYMDHQNQGESMSVRPVMPFGRVREVKGAGREVSLILPPRPNLFDVSYDPAQDAAYFSAKQP